MKLKVLRADPAGNITLFVLDPVDRAQYGSIAEKLMALPGLSIEQVGFLREAEAGADGCMEMAGGEFCGNAARAFAMLLAKRRCAAGRQHLRLRVSGCSGLIGTDVDLDGGTARSEMPLPLFLRQETVNGVQGTLVHLGGIAHLIVENIAPSHAFFFAAEPLFAGLGGLEAYGVMFHDRKENRMTPLVKVPAANSLIWEGSCGSGALASAAAHSAGKPDGSYRFDYIQPAGTVYAQVERKNGVITAGCIGGTVALSEPFEVEI